MITNTYVMTVTMLSSMTPEQFLTFCEDVYNANSSNKIEAQLFLRSVYIGANMPNMSPPKNDKTAIDGYKLGRELNRKL